MNIAQSISLFVLAGLCEIGGGYLVWIWLREGRSRWIGLIGGLVLMLYGVLAVYEYSAIEPKWLYIGNSGCINWFCTTAGSQD